jgi:hypothetical protein
MRVLLFFLSRICPLPSVLKAGTLSGIAFANLPKMAGMTKKEARHAQ